MSNGAELETAISQFPVISQMIGIDIISALAKKDDSSPLVLYLKRSLPDKTKVEQLMRELEKNPKHVGILILLEYHLNCYWTMKHLDNCLSQIKDHAKIEVFVKHLTDSNSFWQGYCEIEVAANIKHIFGKVELEPLLSNNKSVDVMFYLNSNKVFLEVSAPKKGDLYSKVLEKATKKVVELPDVKQRALARLLEEVEHFKGMPDETKSLIVLNLNESDFDDLEIEDLLSGIELRVLVARGAKNIAPVVERAGWTLFESEKDLTKIGAIICYKRNFDVLTGNVVYNKRVFAISFEAEEATHLLKLF